VLGVEIAGALKNVFAIGAGLVEGFGYGYNSKTAIIARGTKEIQTFAIKYGAKKETFFGLAGRFYRSIYLNLMLFLFFIELSLFSKKK
jgi:glycerol-3-phosphate dehydrogenase (NAD(P)+)